MNGETSTHMEPTILVVDDDPRNVKLLEAILSRAGYRVITARGGQEGRALARSDLPDLILLDIMMSGETGFDTCSMLKQDPLTSEIPVIFISALDDVESKVTGFGMDAVDYITKPFIMDEVLARTGRHLKLKSRYKAIIDEQASKLKQIRQAQQAILVRPEDLPEARFGVCYLPIMEAGGDFYDVFRTAPDVFGYFVADVSGHDLGSSYTTSALKVLIQQQVNADAAPEKVMAAINSALLPVMINGKYLTACYACLDRKKFRLTFVSAGHPPIVHLGPAGTANWIDGRGDILGAFETVFFQPVELEASPGDRFFLYTDGIIEGFGDRKKNRDQGLEQLLEACAATAGLPIDRAVDEIVNRISPAGSAPQDDLLLLGVEV